MPARLQDPRHRNWRLLAESRKYLEALVGRRKKRKYKSKGSIQITEALVTLVPPHACHLFVSVVLHSRHRRWKVFLCMDIDANLCLILSARVYSNKPRL